MAKGGAKILFGLFFTIVLASGLAGGGAWYLTEHRAEGYRATVLLVVDPPSTTVGGASLAKWDAPVYAELFQSNGVAEPLLAEVTALYTKKGITSPPTTLETVKKAMRVETSVALQTSSSVTHSPVIRLHYTAEDPEIAAAAANAWATVCLSFASGAASAAEDSAKKVLENTHGELETARQAQAALRAASPLEILKSAAIDGAKAVDELKATIRELEGNAARDDAALKALKAYVAKAPVAVALELSVKEADAEAALAGAKAQSEYAVAKLAEVQAAQAEAQAKWAEAEPKHTIADAAVARLSDKVRALEQSLPSEARSDQPINVISQASTPSAPVGPHRYVIVAGAVILGAVAGLIAYFGLLTMRVYARALDRA